MANLRNSRRAAGGFLRDFQAFLMQGNVVDLAIAVIIGAAFGKIVTSLIEDIVTPLILTPALSAAKVDELAKLSINGIKYGLFLSSVLNFLVVAFVLFLIIRTLAKFKRKEEAIAEAEAAPDPVILSQEKLTEALDRLTHTLENQPR
jgi:large conductance mechanosensitive channel